MIYNHQQKWKDFDAGTNFVLAKWADDPEKETFDNKSNKINNILS